MNSSQDILQKLAEEKYIIDESLATTLYLADQLQKPLLIEGPAGVGKTELAKVWANATGSTLIRLQCYNGLDEQRALYEWNYQKQLLYIQSGQKEKTVWNETKENVFSEEFLLPRPLLKAFLTKEPVVLLIDEIDKSDEEFESFLLEALSDFQVTIPELGTVKAVHHPFIILTSNSYRDFSDALKRRCIHLFINYPSPERELQIIQLKIPGIAKDLAEKLVNFVQALRKLALKKAPSISETLDWARTLVILGANELDEKTVRDTLNIILKYQQDIEKVDGRIAGLL